MGRLEEKIEWVDVDALAALRSQGGAVDPGRSLPVAQRPPPPKAPSQAPTGGPIPDAAPRPPQPSSAQVITPDPSSSTPSAGQCRPARPGSP